MSQSAIGMTPLALMDLGNQVIQEPDGTYTMQRIVIVNGQPQVQTWQCDPNGITSWVPGVASGTYQKFSLNASLTVACVNPDQLGQSGTPRVYYFAFNAAVLLT